MFQSIALNHMLNESSLSFKGSQWRTFQKVHNFLGHSCPEKYIFGKQEILRLQLRMTLKNQNNKKKQDYKKRVTQMFKMIKGDEKIFRRRRIKCLKI